jgi:mannose-6-phosphate isomerase-like protein (cupin superfamily)
MASAADQGWRPAQGKFCFLSRPETRFAGRTDELVCVLEGSVEFEVGGKISQPKPGEELLIPADVVHSVRNRGQTTARWL